MKTKANNYYKNRHGNCSQAVVAAWKEHTGAENVSVEDFKEFGHGKAPQGICGALYAACSIAGEKEEIIKQKFIKESGGHLQCRDIRKAGKLSCPECVSLAAALLEQEHKGGSLK